MSSVKTCGCKGIRSCLQCENLQGNKITSQFAEKITQSYIYCDGCKRAFPLGACDLSYETLCGYRGRCDDHTDLHGDVLEFPGVTVIPEFVSLTEEESLCDEIDRTEWRESQSGRRKQDYGPKVNFKKKKVKTSAFSGLPAFSETLVSRMTETSVLTNFQPIELCNLEYTPERGSAIAPHHDDSWIWGERLVTLTLLCDSRHRMTLDERPGVEVIVPLPRRSLAVVQGPARHQWKHGIRRDDITCRRVAMTFRELTAEFLPGGASEGVGAELLETAATYSGVAIGAEAR